MTAHEAEAPEEGEGGAELGIDAASQDAGAAEDGLLEVGEGDEGLVKEEVEDGVEVGVGVGGEELGEHVEDATEGGAGDAEGGKAGLDGAEGGERGRAEVGVVAEGLLGVDVEALQVEELLAEQKAGVPGGSGRGGGGGGGGWEVEVMGPDGFWEVKHNWLQERGVEVELDYHLCSPAFSVVVMDEEEDDDDVGNLFEVFPACFGRVGSVRPTPGMAS